MKTLINILLLLLITLPAYAFDDWSVKNTLLQTSVIAATTTSYILVNNSNNRAAKYDEYNMTSRPSKGMINTAFIGFAATHTVVAVLLPEPYRTYWQSLGLGISIGTTAYAIGLSVNLK